MRHRVASNQFSRDTKARQALLHSLVRSLVEEGKIVTTKPKAREAKRWFDKVMTIAKRQDLSARRQLHTWFGKREVVNTLMDRWVPALADRNSGYTRETVIGNRRGDNTLMVELTVMGTPERLGTLKSGRDHTTRPVSQSTAKTAKSKVAVKTTAKVTAAAKVDQPAKAKITAKPKVVAKPKAAKVKVAKKA